jgi:hypothetical protein
MIQLIYYIRDVLIDLISYIAIFNFIVGLFILFQLRITNRDYFTKIFGDYFRYSRNRGLFKSPIFQYIYKDDSQDSKQTLFVKKFFRLLTLIWITLIVSLLLVVVIIIIQYRLGY